MALYKAYVLTSANGDPRRVFLVKSEGPIGKDAEHVDGARQLAEEKYNGRFVGVDMEVTSPDLLAKRVRDLNRKPRG